MGVMLLTLLFLFMPGSSHGQCSSINTTIQNKHKILLDLLIKNTPLHDGFYNLSVGNLSDQFYGVSQCKATISSEVCAKCLNASIDYFNRWAEYPEIESVSSFCTTMISNNNIIGVWRKFAAASFGDQGLDNPLAFLKGLSMMQDLASTVPYQPFMYQADEIDVGVAGKRYGLAQCGRDLSKLNCQNCLEDRLLGFGWYIKNRTGWEILGTGCSMWYSNVSDAYKKLDLKAVGLQGLPTSNAPSPSTVPSDCQIRPGTTSVTSGAQSCHRRTGMRSSMWISTLTMLFLATQVFHL